MMLKTISSGCPSASFAVQPVNDSATGFMNCTFPSLLTAITASPMLCNVTPNHSDARCGGRFGGLCPPWGSLEGC
jgi:hypothetical protein